MKGLTYEFPLFLPLLSAFEQPHELEIVSGLFFLYPERKQRTVTGKNTERTRCRNRLLARRLIEDAVQVMHTN